jgi:glycosyltransferase involved in cell wall biosynthesis
MNAPASFAVILPVYNEEDIIESCIERIAAFLDAQQLAAPIITVNDGSQDQTATILEQLKAKYSRLHVATHTANAGYGQACRTGILEAAKMGVDYALVMDGDGTQDPIYIASFFPAMQEGYDFIKATRYAKGGKTVGVPWGRYLPSYFGNKLARLILRLPITDYTNGFRAIRTRYADQITTRERGFSMLIEEVVSAKRCGCRFTEVPYTLTVRTGDSRSKFVYSWKVYYSYLKHLFGMN